MGKFPTTASDCSGAIFVTTIVLSYLRARLPYRLSLTEEVFPVRACPPRPTRGALYEPFWPFQFCGRVPVRRMNAHRAHH